MTRRLLVAGAGLLLLWGAVGHLLVPRIVETRLLAALEAGLDARVGIEAVRFDPYLLDLELEGIEIEGPTAAAQRDRVSIDAVVVDLRGASLFEFAPVLAVTITAPRAALSRDADGSLTMAHLLRTPTEDRPPEPDPRERSALPRLLVDVEINGGRLEFEDRALPGAPTLALDLERIAITTIDTAAPTVPSDLTLRLGGDLGSLDLDGAISLRPSAALRLRLAGAGLEAFSPWLAAATPLSAVAGDLTVDAELAADTTTLRWNVTALRLDGARLELPEGHLTAARLSLDDASGELSPAAPAEGRAAIAALELEDLKLQLVAGPTVAGQLGALRLATASFDAGAVDIAELGLLGPEFTVTLAPAGPGRAPGDDAASTAPVLPGPLRLGDLNITALVVGLIDPATTPAARIELRDGALRAGPLALDAHLVPSAPAAVDLSLAQAGAGRIRFTGTAGPDANGTGALRGTLDLRALDLAVIAPWLEAAVGVDLRGATLITRLEVDAASALRLAGDVRVEDVRVRDAGGVPLLAIDTLALDGLGLDTGERSATVERLGLETPRIRFVRYQDGRTNLDGLGPAAPAGTDQGPAAPPWRWHLGRMELADGYLDFVDETLLTPFATTIEALAGESGAVSDTDSLLALTLEGRIPPVGRLGAEASVDVLDPTADARLRLDFERLSLLRLSPWTSTFAGYDLAGGELDLVLDYRIDGGRLDAANGIVLESLELGDRVASERAADLPLELAIALLRDGDGRIELEVPVSGDLSDPSFDLTPAIMRALRGVLAGVATAPFRALAGLVGARRPLDGVDFEFGAERLDAAARDVLDDVARVLERRPGLVLTVTPLHAGRPDLDALRLARMNASIAATGADRPAALARLAREAFGDAVIDDVRAQYGDAEDPDRAMARELEGLLLTRVVVEEAALDALARARGAAVQAQLLAAGADPRRLRIGAVGERSDLATERVRLPFALAAAQRSAATSPGAPTPGAAP